MQSDRSRTWTPTVHFLLGCSVTALLVIAATLAGGIDFSSSDTIVQHPESDAKGLARAVVKLDETPRIGAEELSQIIETLRTDASQGDVPAARFVVELALLQRAQPAPQDAGAAPPAETPN